VTCIDHIALLTGTGELEVAIGPRPVVAAVYPSSYMKEKGGVFCALENKQNKVKAVVAAGAQAGARYDYRVEWGDGKPASEYLNAKAASWVAAHAYGAAGGVYTLTVTITNRQTGKRRSVTKEVRVVDAATFANP
jgi:hypothetical protein